MYLKINTPDWILYEWKVKEVNVPTDAWYVWILPGHVPMVSVLKPWILKFKAEDNVEDILFEDEWYHVVVSKWMLFVDWENVIVLTSKWVVSPKESEEVLQKMNR